MNFPSMLNEDVLTVFVNGEPHQVQRVHTNFQRVKDALVDPTITIQGMLDILSEATFLTGAFTGKANAEVRDGALWVNDRTVNSTLGNRVLDIVREGMDVDPWLKFVENVFSNPTPTAQNELYDFLEKHTLPITEDGHFLAYKKVRGDYTDVYTGRFSNRIGSTNEMPREQVDHDRTRTCSQGFHFCSREYLKSFGGERVVILKINPADVVSIPNDYDFAKGRCWRYEVVGEIEEQQIDSFEWDPILYDDYEDDYPYNDYDDYDDYDDDRLLDEEVTYDDHVNRLMASYRPDPKVPSEAPVSPSAGIEDTVPPPYTGDTVVQPEVPQNVTDGRLRSHSIWERLRGI